MCELKELFQKIADCVQRGQNVALATVISRKGSLPMSQQAKMLVFRDGSIMGTIGGGKLEADVIRAAQQVLINETPKIVKIDLTADQIEADGLTCGGTVGIFIEPFTAETNITLFDAIAAIYSSSQPAVIATLLNEKFSQDGGKRKLSQDFSRKMVIPADGTTVGTVGDETVAAQIVQVARTRMAQDIQEILSIDLPEPAARELGTFPETQLRIFLETVLPLPTAYLFGGGHIAFHLSRLLRLIGFDFVVIDDRQEFANSTRFPEARECIVHDFDHVFEVLAFHPLFAYMIIVTRGHKSDFAVLDQAIRTNAKYIGMIGSKRKINLLFQRLQEQGIPQAVLNNIHAPIGLAIGADTPEEIAVSIAAELIQVRRSKQ